MDGPSCRRAGRKLFSRCLQGKRGRGSLRGLINVRPEDVARNAGDGLNPLCQRETGFTCAGRNQANHCGRDAKRSGKLRLGQSVFDPVLFQRFHAILLHCVTERRKGFLPKNYILSMEDRHRAAQTALCAEKPNP